MEPTTAYSLIKTNLPVSMLIQVEIDAEDMIAFSAERRKNSIALRVWNLSCFVILTVLFTSLFIAGNLLNSSMANALAGLAVSVATIILIIILQPVYLAHYIRSHFNDPHNKRMLGHYELQMDEKGLLAKNADSASFVTWERVQKVTLNKDYGYLYVASNSAHIIPRRCLTPEEFDQFMAKAKEHWLASNFPTQTAL